ncbi:unnamed protein product [Effrenium voratum]|uniref:SAM domain-containing protein n=1 Tax=Effrenium voratum TaxID=2562239 RepID=A0AA36INM4_9DINO|nr:unnamed protein product [Effrenium voratum]
MRDISIQRWLESIDEALGDYAACFREFGYDNLNLLKQADDNDFSEDLDQMEPKKNHRRLILRQFAVLKADSTQAPARNFQQRERVSEPTWGATSANRCPFLQEVQDFERKQLAQLSSRINSGDIVYIPVWCLRFVQGHVHGQMVFSGHQDDRSVYELLHDLLNGRKRCEDLEPLEVVWDGELYSLSNRRLLALLLLQGGQRHKAVWAPCYLFGPQDDSRVSSRYAMKDTTESLGHGMGVLLHGRQPEAWHLGKPLFRCASEWCDAEVPEPAPSREIVPYESKLPRAGLQAGMLVKAGQEPAKLVSLEAEWAKVRRRNGWEEWLPREELIPEDFSMIPDTDVMEIREKIMQAPDCGGWELYTGLTWPGKEAADCDFSVGMAVDVDGWYSATVVAQYGVESIKVRYHGYDRGSEEWVGRDRLQRRNDLEKLEEQEPESRLCLAQPASRQNPLETVCCLWLVGRCWSWKSHTMGKRVYLHKDVPGLPCGYGTACRYKHNESRGLHEESGDASRNQAVDVPTKLESPVLQVGMLVKVVRRWQEYFGEVLSIRRGSEAPVQVRYLQDWGHSDDSYNDWLSIESLHVPSYADISVGMTVTVDERYAATVVDLQQGELRAPVKIRYETYNYEEWAGADRLPSTCISFLPAILSRPEDSAEDNVTICCLWLDGKCWHPSTHKSGKGWHLHQVRPDVPCINGSNCKHCAARSSLRAIQDVPSASVDRAARAARADKPSEVLPWTSEPPDPEQAERAVRKAIHVVEESCACPTPSRYHGHRRRSCKKRPRSTWWRSS